MRAKAQSLENLKPSAKANGNILKVQSSYK